MSVDLRREDRFWSKVDVGDWQACWLWTGQVTPEGYGHFGVWGPGWASTAYAHRFAYELLVGPIPEGLVLDHVKAWGCENTSCVNPLHLEPVTQRENVLRGTGITALNATKSHCLRGHEFSERNTRLYRGKRVCRPCRAENERTRRAARWLS